MMLPECWAEGRKDVRKIGLWRVATRRELWQLSLKEREQGTMK